MICLGGLLLWSLGLRGGARLFRRRRSTEPIDQMEAMEAAIAEIEEEAIEEVALRENVRAPTASSADATGSVSAVTAAKQQVAVAAAAADVAAVALSVQ